MSHIDRTDAAHVKTAQKATQKKAEVVEQVGMMRWMRVTARKHSVGKSTGNAAADAAADALAKLLAEAKKLA